MKFDLSQFWHLFKIPEPQREYKFHPTRKWRFDFAWPDRKIAVEIEGGIWIKAVGSHARPIHFQKDIEKYNQATLLGWKIFRFLPNQFKNGEAAELLEKVFSNKDETYLGELFIEGEMEETPDY